LNDLDSGLARVLASYAAAVLAKDVAAFMRLYDPRVRVFDAWGVWSHEGADAWQRAVEGWFASLRGERVKVSFDEVQCVGGRDVSVITAIVTYAAVSPEGAPLRTMQNRLTWVLRTSGHVPRIVHEHTSPPIDFEHATAILQRAGAERRPA
jgi:ketosteroid isomerase-like protein